VTTPTPEKREENRQQREKLAAMTPAQYKAEREAFLKAISNTTTDPRKAR
jgi:hypothetical protein